MPTLFACQNRIQYRNLDLSRLFRPLFRVYASFSSVSLFIHYVYIGLHLSKFIFAKIFRNFFKNFLEFQNTRVIKLHLTFLWHVVPVLAWFQWRDTVSARLKLPARRWHWANSYFENNSKKHFCKYKKHVSCSCLGSSLFRHTLMIYT